MLTFLQTIWYCHTVQCTVYTVQRHAHCVQPTGYSYSYHSYKSILETHVGHFEIQLKPGSLVDTNVFVFCA